MSRAVKISPYSSARHVVWGSGKLTGRATPFTPNAERSFPRRPGAAQQSTHGVQKLIAAQAVKQSAEPKILLVSPNWHGQQNMP